jgi:hypothetical protein
MANNLNNSAVQELACKAICMIAQKDTNAGDYLGREGACKAVIAAISKHSTDKSIAKWSMSAVTALTQCKPVHAYEVADDNSIRLHDAGVCEAIATALQKHSGDTAVLIAACIAIQALAHEYSTTVKLIDAGALTSVIDAISQHLDNVHVVGYGCLVLVGLSSFIDNEMKTIMGNDGACELLPKVIRAHIRNSDIVHSACRAVEYLARDERKRPIAFFPDDNNVELGDNKVNINKLKAAGVNSVLKSVRQVHSGNQQIMNSAQNALANLRTPWCHKRSSSILGF